jgi:tetratricopeptide (TPR) repeat protein
VQNAEQWNRTERFLCIITFAAVFCLATFDITEHDYWWHLKTGEYIVQNLTIPHEDIFSYTATKPWIAHYWLADVILYLLYRISGTPGLILFNAALVTLSFWIVLKTGRIRGSPPQLLLIFCFLAALASRPRFYVRPETFSFLFVATYLLLYASFVQRGKNYPLFLYPFLQLLWFNIYGGGAITGVVILGCLFVGECVNFILSRLFPAGRQGVSAPSHRLSVLGLSIIFSVALSFVNPNSYRTFFYFTISRNEIFRHIVEWKTTTWSDLIGLHGFIILCGALSFLGRGKRSNMADVALFGVFSLASLYAWRTLPFLALISIPIIAGNLKDAWEKLLSTAQRRSVLRRAFALVLILYTPWYLFSDVGHFYRDYSFGLGVNMKLLPVQACDFVEENGIKGNMFNSYGFGGYLIWRFWPERKVFVDGRVEMYGLPFLGEYMFYWHPEVWQRYEKDYGINYAIIDREPNYTTRYLDKNKDWSLVFFDDRALVYLKRTPENEPLIKRYGYHYLRPGSLNFSYLDPLLENEKTRREVIRELERSLHENEMYNLNVHLMLAHCYAHLGIRTYRQAIEQYEKALKIMPESDEIRGKIQQMERALSGH